MVTTPVARRIARLTRESGGASVDIGGTSFVGTRGYAVSVFEGRSRIISGYPSAEDIDGYIADNIDILDDVRADSVAFVGTWYNQGQTHIDCSVRVRNLAQALRLGREHNQRAIFDLSRLEDIPIDGEVS